MARQLRTVEVDEQRILINWLWGLGAIILIGGLFSWYQYIYKGQYRVFWGMVSNNLSIYGVTRTVNQRDGASSVNQDLQLELGAHNVAREVKTVNQVASDNKKTTVVSETIGTPSQNFARYTYVNSPKIDNQGKKTDFSLVLNHWGNESIQGHQSIFSEAVFSSVPFAQLNKSKRTEIMDYMKSQKVYDVQYKDAKEVTKDGKRAYRYTVKVKIKSYVEMLQKLDTAMNIGRLKQVDTGTNNPEATVELRMIVAIGSHQLLQVQYADSPREENYRGYGIRPSVALPKANLSRSDLEQKFQTLLLGS